VRPPYRITEVVSGTSRHANWRDILTKHGTRFIDEALRDNPDGPVAMVTTRYATEIDYRVIVGELTDGDHGKARVIWDRSVSFGATDARVAGGSDFVAAARAQDEVAFAAHALLNAVEVDGELPEAPRELQALADWFEGARQEKP
jgi:hypothetical protein